MEKSEFQRGDFTKNQYIGVIAKKGGACTFCRFKGGLGKKEGGGIFEEGGAGSIPQCTLCCPKVSIYFNDFIAINGKILTLIWRGGG